MNLNTGVAATQSATAPPAANNVGHFDGSITSSVLENYLSRAVQCAGTFGEGTTNGSPHFEDDLRMLRNIRAKFVGRAVIAWDISIPDDEHFENARTRATRAHAVDPDIILQACIFEIVHTSSTTGSRRDRSGVDAITVPPWVFQEFGEPVVERNFDYTAMLSPDGHGRAMWGENASVPDITRPETKKWFYYRARRYIDAGYEALHFGQAGFIGMNDSDASSWDDILTRIRRYAAQSARRHYVLCDAHLVMTSKEVPVRRGGKLLWDFASFPLRIAEAAQPLRGELRLGFLDSLYGRAPGGVHPSGWKCDTLPQLYEFDNCVSGLTLEHVGATVWGAEETTWFANQPQAYRNEFLRHAHDWIWHNAPHGFLQAPGRRPAAVPVLRPKIHEYVLNTRSTACPHGFNQEETVKSLWDDPRYADLAGRPAARIVPLEPQDVQTSSPYTLEQLRELYRVHGMPEIEQQPLLGQKPSLSY